MEAQKNPQRVSLQVGNKRSHRGDEAKHAGSIQNSVFNELPTRNYEQPSSYFWWKKNIYRRKNITTALTGQRTIIESQKRIRTSIGVQVHMEILAVRIIVFNDVTTRKVHPYIYRKWSILALLSTGYPVTQRVHDHIRNVLIF